MFKKALSNFYQPQLKHYAEIWLQNMKSHLRHPSYYYKKLLLFFSSSIRMSGKSINFGDKYVFLKKKFYKSKKSI